jgi:hypothetical protein
MSKMKKFVLGLFLILLVSGCAGMPDIFNGLFPGSGGTTVKELPPDILTIQNINVIPSSSIRPSDQFSVSFEVKNQEENLMISNVNYALFDTGLCKWKEGNVPNASKWDYFVPQETKLIDWTFEAPSADEIAYLSTKCPIRFKINYTYNATSQIDVDVISKERLWEIQRSGNATTFTPTLNVGRGPIKIYFDFGVSLPVRNESILPIYITVEDKGTGIYGNVEINSSYIKFPSEFTDISCDHFSCVNSTCDKNEKIPMIKRKSPQIRCSVKTPNVPIERTFFITAGINYAYDVEGEVNVEVKT